MLEGYSSRDSRAADGSIETEQLLVIPAPVVPLTVEGGEALGLAYWDAIAAVSRSLVRVAVEEHGVVIGLAGVSSPLLRLGPAKVTVEGDRLTCGYPIVGGLLVRRGGGALVVAQSGGGPAELRVAVTGFFSRLGGGPVYRQLQQRIHLAVSRRFFRRLLEGCA
jgi:hypothetical protein